MGSTANITLVKPRRESGGSATQIFGFRDYRRATAPPHRARTDHTGQHRSRIFGRNRQHTHLAASIEKGAEPDADYVSRFAWDKGLDHPTTRCNDVYTRARLTVALAALGAASKANDPRFRDAAEKNALDIAEHRLSCNPLDGNAWLRLAMVEAEGNRTTPATIDALHMSYRSAPNESWIIEARLPFATRLYLAEVPGFDIEYLNDLSRYATYEPEDQVAETYVRSASRVRALLRPLIADQSDSRKEAISADIDRLGATFEVGNPR
jgi:hypothetical protein